MSSHYPPCCRACGGDATKCKCVPVPAIDAAKLWMNRPLTPLDRDCCAYFSQYQQAVKHLSAVIEQAESRPECGP